MLRIGCQRSLRRALVAVALPLASSSARHVHISHTRLQSSTSQDRTRAPGGENTNRGTDESTATPPPQGVRMHTLGDYLRALPRGIRELLLYSPALALLCFVLYQQKTYFRDPGERWYRVFFVWRERRVGGWLLNSPDAPLPPLDAKKHTKASKDPQHANADASAVHGTHALARIAFCETQEAQELLNRMGAPAAGTPAASTPPIPPFTTMPAAAAPASMTDETVWGDDVYAVRALRSDGALGPIVGYETVSISSWQSAAEPWYKRLTRFLA